jgi:ABC-type multidrug transport system fused ATPase/permease subunit
LAAAIVLLIGFLVAEKLARMLEEFYFARFEQRITLEIHRDLIAKVLRFPKSFFDDNQTGYLMSRLSEDVEGIRWFFSSTVVHIISNVIRFVGGIAFLFYLEWRLALIVLILLPALGVCIRYFSGKMHTLSHHSMEQKAGVSAKLQESLSGSSLIKAYASEDRAQKSLMLALRGVLRISLQQTIIGSLANLVVGSMPGSARVLALAVGAVWVIKGQWTLGSLLAFQAYLAYVFSPAQFLASANLQLQKALAALERVSALFDIVVEENMGAGEKVKRLKGEIEFKNVSFSYNGSQPILEDLSFHIRPGEKIAILGPSGVGKTTLLSLILRFYRPTCGEIYFDGRPASDYEVSSLRQRIGYVSQQPRLAAGSLMENLRYGNPEASKAQVMEATKIVGIHDFIESLPTGYDTQINENGINLSEGQKQRLAIARALIKAPDILVLDEPTAALDSVIETSIFDALPALIQQKTLFIVAHRISTIRDADQIFLLDENRLVAIGSHQFLMETDRYYRSMAATQQVADGKTFAAGLMEKIQ